MAQIKIAVVVGSASTPITNDKCTATSVHWMYDTHSSSVGVGQALAQIGLVAPAPHRKVGLIDDAEIVAEHRLAAGRDERA